MANATVDNTLRHSGISSKKLKEILKLCLEAYDLASKTVHLSVVNDSQIHELNLQWRGKDKPTDVLSFSQVETVDGDDFPEISFPGPTPLGDIVISFETARVQAERIGHSLETEYRRLIVHGFLHLLGHDHIHGGRQAGNMRREENRVIAFISDEIGEA